MVSESKYTSWPSGPSASKVAAVLTMKAIAMPSDTGRSMPMRRARRSRQALRKNGPQENSITGSVSTQEAHRSSRAASPDMSPGWAMYEG